MSNREYREKRSRITLIIRIALIFFIAGVYPAISRAGMTIAQNVPDSVFNYTYEMMVGSRDSVKILLDANNKLLRVDSADQKSLKYFTAQINDLDSEIDMFKNSEVKKESPFLSWDGFYINFIPAYVLNPAYISNQVVKTLKYAISADFTFKVLDKFKLAIEPILPIGDKFRIQGKIGYRLF